LLVLYGKSRGIPEGNGARVTKRPIDAAIALINGAAEGATLLSDIGDSFQGRIAIDSISVAVCAA